MKNFFCVYDERDKGLRKDLETHLALLKRSGAINLIGDRILDSEQTWKGETDTRLAKADFVVLFISPQLFSSGYLEDVEMAVIEHFRNNDALTLIPLLARSTEGWLSSSLYKFVPLPKSRQFIGKKRDRDALLAGIAKDIRSLVEA